jgi:peptidoglycan/LPS O-acetylase OafA/YrhL
MVFLPFLIWYKNKGKGTLGDKAPLVLIILMGLIPCVTQHDIFKIINIDGNKSILEYSAYFLLGYFFLSNENLLKELDKYRFLLLGLFIAYTCFMEYVIDGAFREMASWLAVLAILGLGHRYLNLNGKITSYLSKSSFGVYVFHLPWIVITAFFVFKFTQNPVLQIPLTFLPSIILTYGTYEVCRRISVFRWMFGLRK